MYEKLQQKTSELRRSILIFITKVSITIKFKKEFY
jgi:hypothetical protein